MTTVFIHGLESSSKGTKARWFRINFPAMVIPDFKGILEERMEKLANILANKNKLVLIGSSFGGLMATIYAQKNEQQVQQVILLAPALNFPEFSRCPTQRVKVPTQLYIGRNDTICPPSVVIPKAQQIFIHLSVHLSNDDHLLKETFPGIDWYSMLKI